jgi:succinate dehydrogenase/fumarate reductase flavoprotein subunit
VLHKAPEHVSALVNPPFGAFDCTVEHAVYAAFTLGGLRTRPSGAVLTPAGDEIPGLFAAGRATSGVCVQGYSSGLSLADGTFFGRLAGESAARG